MDSQISDFNASNFRWTRTLSKEERGKSDLITKTQQYLGANSYLEMQRKL